MRTIYMAVTPDKYELPIDFAESAGELAEKIGTTKNNIQSSISKNLPGSFTGYRFVRVNIRI